ncbi:MAG TPA: chemotaxis protein CheW [Oligoflexia bacterium]|nr:chemotaxis protein CheW [Oligoflexia bacterium]
MLALKNEYGQSIGEMLQFVTFELLREGDKTLVMALNVQKIKEVVELCDLSPMPSGCENVLGIYDLRGCPVPVVDVLSLISVGKKSSHLGKDARLLICELQNIWVGIPVNRTGRIFTCPSSSFLPPPVGSKIETRKIITGLIRKDATYVPVLDLDSLLDSVGLIEEHTSRVTPQATYPGKRVLIADDSKVILKKLNQLFSQMGFIVDSVENGAEALKKIESEPHYDLVFTDIEMPILDGIAMAREIKGIPGYADTPILFNSALSNPALISDIEKEKLGRYQVKFDSDLIVRHLEIIFGQSLEGSLTQPNSSSNST